MDSKKLKKLEGERNYLEKRAKELSEEYYFTLNLLSEIKGYDNRLKQKKVLQNNFRKFRKGGSQYLDDEKYKNKEGNLNYKITKIYSNLIKTYERKAKKLKNKTLQDCMADAAKEITN